MSFYWNNDSDTPRVGAWIATLVAVLVLAWGISVGVWGLGVATAGLYGRGEAHKKVQDPTNRLFQDQHFFRLYGDIKAQTAQVRSTRASLDATTDPSEHTRLQSVLLGLQNLCQQNVQTYNADAQAYVSAQFRSANLPATVPTGADDNCKES